MQRVKIQVISDNVGQYVDLFVNHSCRVAFPWLVAHHFNFFGSFDNLSILDTLLKHMRGFNVNIGSKKRKLYFSDVNHILSSTGELKVSCCENFKPTEHFNDSLQYSKMSTIIHQVGDFESLSSIHDSLDPEIDLLKDKNPIKNRIVIDEIEDKKSAPSIIDKILKLKGVCIEQLFTPKAMEIIKKSKEEREKVPELIKLRNDLNEELNQFTVASAVISTNLHESATPTLRTMLMLSEKMISFLDNSSIIHDALKAAGVHYQPSRSSNPSDDFIKGIKDYLELKKELNYSTPEEMNYKCNQISLMYKADLHDELRESYIEELNRCKKIREEGGDCSTRELSKRKKVMKDLEDEIGPLVKSYTQRDNNFSDPYYLAKPMIYKAMLKNTDCRSDDFIEGMNMFTRGEDIPTYRARVVEFSQYVKNVLSSIVDAPDVSGIRRHITDIYEQSRKYILSEINMNRCPDVGILNQNYAAITKYRKNCHAECDNEVFNMDKLLLNDYEKARIDSLTSKLISEESSYYIAKRDLGRRRLGLIYCEQNVRIQSRFGVNPRLPEELWHDKVFERMEGSTIETVENYESNLRSFEEITGFSAYNNIIGGYDGTLKRMEVDIKVSKSPNKELFEDCQDVIQKYKKRSEHISSMDIGYLRALVGDSRPDLKARYRTERAKVNEKIDRVRDEIDKLNTVSAIESIYDCAVDRSHVTSRELKKKEPIFIKKVNKIENDYRCKVQSRGKADQTFIRLTTEAAFKSKNIYEELEIEEAISDSNSIINELFNSDIAPYLCYDHKKAKNYRSKKVNHIIEKKASKTGLDIIKEYNKFDIENNSRSNKKYDVTGMISYVKLLLAMKILKLNTGKTYFGEFGLKKCQSTYVSITLSSLANRMLKKSGTNVKFPKL